MINEYLLTELVVYIIVVLTAFRIGKDKKDKHNNKYRKVTVDIVTRNELVSWSAIIAPYTYSLTAVCLQPVKALSINGNTLKWLLENNHAISNVLWAELTKVVTSRLEQTRCLLVSERLLTQIR